MLKCAGRFIFFFHEIFAKILAGKEKVRIFAALEPAKPLNDAQMCGSFFYVHIRFG